MSDPLSDLNRSMPFSDEAEKGLLCCLLQNPNVLVPDYDSRLGEVGFYVPAHRTLFRAMKALVKRSIGIDLATLSSFLLDSKLMDNIGGPAMLPELLSFVPTPAHYPHYLEIMRGKTVLRATINVCTESIQSCYEYHENPDQCLEVAAGKLTKLQMDRIAGRTQEGVTIGQMFDKFMAETSAGVTKPAGLPTPFQWLNQECGGAVPGNVVLFAGKRGTGKSAATRQIGWHVAKEGIGVSNFQFEMTERQEFNAVCSLEGVDAGNWLTGNLTPDDYRVIRRVGKMAQDIPYKIHDDVKLLPDVIARMRSDVIRRKTKLFIIDGPQRVKGDRSQGRERELSDIMDTFKEFAKQTGTSILMPIHINAELQSRGSEDLENLCDVKILMASRLNADGGTEVIWKLDKNRFGTEKIRCKFDFFGKHLTFREIGPTKDDIVAKVRA